MEEAGGIAYPETDKYDYKKWYPTTGLTDLSAYKSIRFNVRQDNLLLLWRNAYLELNGQVVQKVGGAVFANNSRITMIHNAIPHLFSNVELNVRRWQHSTGSGGQVIVHVVSLIVLSDHGNLEKVFDKVPLK